jgi:tetratricopeptide (TPR) repeat protein
LLLFIQISMAILPIKAPAELIKDIQTKLSENNPKEGAAYALIVGAGFSFGIVPLPDELLHKRIGSFYYHQNAGKSQKLCRDYWREFNAARVKEGEPPVELNDDGLPENPSVAYQLLFTYRTTNALFASAPPAPTNKFLARLKKSRPAVDPPAPRVMAGEAFVKEFLQKVLDSGGYEARAGSGQKYYTSTGSSDLNGAHFFLASLLELQQSGKLFGLRPFCRTILTTNFDTLLQNALQLVNVLYCLTDRPESGIDDADFPEYDRAIHLVYTHGSILRHNAASTTAELSDLTGKNAATIGCYLNSKDVLVFGYGGWEDTLMSALTLCDKEIHRIYWCNVYPADKAEEKLAPAVRDLISSYQGRAVYVPLGDEGADGFMRDLYRALAPNDAIPLLFRDPFEAFRQRLARLQLSSVTFAVDDLPLLRPRTLPLPRLERSAESMKASALTMLSDASACFGYGEKDPVAISELISERQEFLRLDEAFLLAVSGDDEQAVTLWTQIIELAKPGSEADDERAAVAAYYIGIVHSRAGKFDLAVAAYSRACEFVFAWPWLQVDSLNYCGAAHQQLGQTESAIEDFSRAIEIGRKHREAVGNGRIGRALIYRGLTRQWSGQSGAEDDFKQARELKPLPEECKRLFALRNTS